MSDKENDLIGKTIVAIWLADDNGAIRFDTTDGDEIIARADGECCSKTWIESLDAPDVLIGSPIISVEDIDMPDLGTPEECECLAYYGCKITTAKGSCVIDYRNDSNGYYGGSLVWPSHEYFYGGVWRQNKSTMQWQKVVPGEQREG